MRLSTLLRNRPGLLGTGYVVAGFRPHHGPHTRQPEPSRVPAPARGACAYVAAAHLLSIPCICVPKHAHLRVFFGHSACCSCHACHAAVGLGSEGTFYRCIRGVGLSGERPVSTATCFQGNVSSTTNRFGRRLLPKRVFRRPAASSSPRDRRPAVDLRRVGPIVHHPTASRIPHHHPTAIGAPP